MVEKIDMGSLNSPPPLPTIDFSNPNFKPGTNEWESVASQVKKAMEDYGCFYAKFNSTDHHQDETFGLLKSMFDVPQEKKMEGIQELGSSYSYVPPRPQSNFPFYEAFAIDDAQALGCLESFVGSLLPHSSSEPLHSFKKEALRLQEIIRRMIVESLGLEAEKYLEDHINSVQQSFRMQKYEASKTKDPKVGFVPHIDLNTLTILYQNQVSGLQVQNKEGDWIDVTPLPSSFIVFMAESLNAWANGRFYVPLHKVMLAEDEDRYSIGLFSRPKDGYTVQAPEELVDEDHPLLYGPFDYSEFRKILTDNLRKGILGLNLKAYCGLQN